MDIEDARTFMEIVEAGSFVHAAIRLNVTQSTVSARIKELELRLGQPLFVRSKAGATMTPAGLRFRRHAETILKAWRQARQEIALPPDYRAVLAVGGQFSLWDGFLLEWLRRMRTLAPDIALRTEVAQSDELMRQLSEGVLDLGVMYTPQSRAGLSVEQLLVDTMILVSTERGSGGVGDPGYVYVDWGPEFQAAHSLAFPDLQTPGLAISLGALALQHLLAVGGSGFLPARVVAPLLAAGRLFRVGDAPEFARPAYAVYRAGSEDEAMAEALHLLRELAAEKAEGNGK
ncbi:MAG: LysR family transcriptional regulator [Rhodospirillaceae bacterium]|nr:LysR family transcriptional regulator [Rhodospirillaceae bacterium]